MPFDIPYADLMDQHGFIPANHQQPAFFLVKARRLFDETGEELAGWKRIVNEETHATLHVAPDSYHLISNEDAFGAFETTLASSSLDLTGMRIGTDYAGHGTRCFRQYLLPAHQVEVRPGNAVALRIIMMNSYDGTTKFRGQAGAYSFVCANTSIAGNDYASFAFTHRGDAIDFTGAIQKLVGAAEQHVITAERWKAWPRIGVSDEQAIGVFKAVPFATKARTDHLVHAWVRARNDEGPQGGPNLWALFNVLTAWSTHGETDVAGGKGQVRFTREGYVAKTVEGPVWAALAG